MVPEKKKTKIKSRFAPIRILLNVYSAWILQKSELGSKAQKFLGKIWDVHPKILPPILPRHSLWHFNNRLGKYILFIGQLSIHLKT